jgi:hypothetical protein
VRDVNPAETKTTRRTDIEKVMTEWWLPERLRLKSTMTIVVEAVTTIPTPGERV